MNDEQWVPDVLLGDVFVLAMNRTREELMEDEKIRVEAVVAHEINRGKVHPMVKKSPALTSARPPVQATVSKESTRLFLFNTYAVGSFPASGWSVGGIPLLCDACGASIRKASQYIRCVECVNPLVDLCVHCFANGAEFGNHKRSHSYSVVRNKINNRKLVKLDIFEYLQFLLSSHEKGSLNFSIFEKSVLHESAENSLQTVDNNNTTGLNRSFAGNNRNNRVMGSRGGLRVNQPNPSSVGTNELISGSVAKASTDAEKVYLTLINMLTTCQETLIVGAEIPSSTDNGGNTSSDTHPSNYTTLASTSSGGPANFNFLRDEFEYEYLPEAETVLAAVNVAPTSSASLLSVMEAYNGILDERERRKRCIIFSGLSYVKEFASSAANKKRKSDEKEIFERCRIFLKPVSDFLDTAKNYAARTNMMSPSLRFLDELATLLTTRKRLTDRLKRLVVLKQNGITCGRLEDALALQFDTDRKKRADLIKSSSVHAKIFAWLPTQAADLSVSPPNLTTLIFQSLPWGHLVTDPDSVSLCVQLFISPQHFVVVERTMHSLIRNNNLKDAEAILKNVIKDGIFGTTKRLLQAACKMDSLLAPTASNVFSIEEMRQLVVLRCRSSFKY